MSKNLDPKEAESIMAKWDKHCEDKGIEREGEQQKGRELTKGCVVMMKSSSGMKGYGNGQCVSAVCEELGTISLYGHNQHYKTYDIDRVLEYPAPTPKGITISPDVLQVAAGCLGSNGKDAHQEWAYKKIMVALKQHTGEQSD